VFKVQLPANSQNAGQFLLMADKNNFKLPNKEKIMFVFEGIISGY